MLHKDYSEKLKTYHSHLHEHSLAKLRRYPLFKCLSKQKENMPKVINFFASHKIERTISSDWEEEIENEIPLGFDFRFLTVDDEDEDDDDEDKDEVELVDN